MSCIRFIRTTHHNGIHRLFSAEALQFWREYGATVGEVLRPETPLTLTEIVTACQEYVLEFPQFTLYPILNEQHIAWCLIKLIEYGMVGVVV
jgi:hypothetical protein